MIKIYQDLLLKWIEVYYQSRRDNRDNKAPILRSDLCDFSDEYIVVKELLLLLILVMQKEIKQWHLKIMRHLSTAFQKLMVYKLTTHKI